MNILKLRKKKHNKNEPLKQWCWRCEKKGDHETRDCALVKREPLICLSCGTQIQVGMDWTCPMCEVTFNVSRLAVITIDPSLNVGPSCIHSTQITIEPLRQQLGQIFVGKELLKGVVELAGSHDLRFSGHGHALTKRAYFTITMSYNRTIHQAINTIRTPWETVK